jgi:hypothetical protein
MLPKADFPYSIESRGTSLNADDVESKGLPQNSGMSQRDVGELQMDKSQIVAGFLFPADKKTSHAVRPGVAVLDYPATCALAGTTFGLKLALARNVQDVSQTSGERFRGLGTVSFVQAKMLLIPSDRTNCNACSPPCKEHPFLLLLSTDRACVQLWDRPKISHSFF